MDPFTILCYSLPLLYLLFFFIWKIIDQKKHQGCYILDYQCYKPGDDRKLSTKFSGEVIRRNKNLGLNEYKFLLKAIVSSGIGEQTYAPKMVFDGRETCPTYEDGMVEMDEFFVDSIGKLLDRQGVSPQEIDVLVVNVSMLACLPSLASRIINRYKMKDNLKVYNLTGMGCSASLISVNIVQNVFKTQRNLYALVVTSESLSPNWYSGNDRSMILANCLFRTGGCAVLLTNKPGLMEKSMFKLKCLVRTHHGAKDESYGCCIQTEDESGRIGFHLGKTLPKAATRAFVDNLKEIAPKILPIKELLRFVILSSHRKLTRGGVGGPFLPAHGREGGDRRDRGESEPERAKKRLKKGDRVFMISFGAGFKCNSCLWEMVRDLGGEGENVWNDDIHNYPPQTLTNPFLDKFGWLQHEDPNTFTVPDDYVIP
nr:3-ketoacyl-CoA synthase 12-like [Ipomoea batatas]